MKMSKRLEQGKLTCTVRRQTKKRRRYTELSF